MQEPTVSSDLPDSEAAFPICPYAAALVSPYLSSRLCWPSRTVQDQDLTQKPLSIRMYMTCKQLLLIWQRDFYNGCWSQGAVFRSHALFSGTISALAWWLPNTADHLSPNPCRVWFSRYGRGPRYLHFFKWSPDGWCSDRFETTETPANRNCKKKERNCRHPSRENSDIFYPF